MAVLQSLNPKNWNIPKPSLPKISAPKILNGIAQTALETGSCAGTGFIAGHMLTPLALDPVHGALLCGAAALISKITEPVFDKIFDGPKASEASRTLGFMLNRVCALGIATLVAVGTELFEITPVGFGILACVTISTTLLIISILKTKTFISENLKASM